MNSVENEPLNTLEILGCLDQSAGLDRNRPELDRDLSVAGSKDAVLLVVELKRPAHRRTRDL
ncbi:hypothetical protein [Rhodopirellula bahusiensis]|uniref:hypothetical protein n=1 Tax=Rhodopirellula bahusiensis TaxID=2014065 RepID=UPI003267DF2B